jgi:hypothetical protein
MCCCWPTFVWTRQPKLLEHCSLNPVRAHNRSIPSALMALATELPDELSQYSLHFTTLKACENERSFAEHVARCIDKDRDTMHMFGSSPVARLLPIAFQHCGGGPSMIALRMPHVSAFRNIDTQSHRHTDTQTQTLTQTHTSCSRQCWLMGRISC